MPQFRFRPDMPSAGRALCHKDQALRSSFTHLTMVASQKLTVESGIADQEESARTLAADITVLIPRDRKGYAYRAGARVHGLSRPYVRRHISQTPFPDFYGLVSASGLTKLNLFSGREPVKTCHRIKCGA